MKSKTEVRQKARQLNVNSGSTAGELVARGLWRVARRPSILRAPQQAIKEKNALAAAAEPAVSVLQGQQALVCGLQSHVEALNFVFLTVIFNKKNSICLLISLGSPIPLHTSSSTQK